MKSDVTYVNSSAQRHTEGLNGAIQVHVKKRILIVPDSSGGIGYFITHEPDAIDTRIGLDLVYCRACPSHDGRLHSHRDSDR